MDCTYFRALGSAIIDNEASDAEIAEFNEHIASCEDCRLWFDALKILKDETSHLSEAAPPELKARVMASVANNKKSKGSFFSRFRFTAVAAVVAIIIFAANGFIGGEEASNLPQVASETPNASSRMVPIPDQILPGTDTETPEVPYDRAFSYVAYLKITDIPDFLEDAEFESHNGYRYYITDIQYDSLADFPHEIIALNLSLDTEGLIIIKE